MTKPKNLLHLAQQFDRTDASDLEARVQAAHKLQEALGDRYHEFDERYSNLFTANPAEPAAAAKVLTAMGLAD